MGAVTCLLGDPKLPREEERALRERLTAKALTTLTQGVEEPTVFTSD